MTSSSSAEQQKKALTTLSKFSEHYGMHTYQWNLANDISSLKKSSTLSITGIRQLPLKTQAINNMHPPKTAKQVCTFLGLNGYYRKFIKNFDMMAKPLTLLTHQKAKFEWTPVHHTAFFTLKDAVTQAPILCYPDPAKQYIVYTDASDNACRTQLSQDQDGMEFPIAFLSHAFMDTQRK